MLEINDVTKDYGNGIGNFNISLKINDGEIYGILGPNGAGKSTLMRQIMGFVKSDQGEISINGINPWTDSDKVMVFTGYIAGEISLFENLTGRQYIYMIADFKGNVDKKFIEKLIKHFELNVNTKIKKMSKGMKQKIAIICAFMIKPKFLVLDEPTSGLDPLMQDRFNDIVIKLKNKYQTTVIICSHIFEQVANVCDRIGFLKNGRIIQEYEVKDKDIRAIENEFKTLYGKEKVL